MKHQRRLPFIYYMDTEKKETTIPNPHDVFAKEVLSYKQNGVDFFGGILPEKLQANLDLRTSTRQDQLLG